ncbi:glycosyltransferase [Pseudoalteromonas sp. Hal040]|uniref:glycosyltransferase n=1 Tax=unclassified Pseudoalteromonas TaxID=194690 RepID=UPI00301CF655
MNKKKILHITESFGGGVTTAINTYVKNSPKFDHHLLAATREGDETGEEGKTQFKTSLLLSRNLSSLKRAIQHIKKINPDVIHLHSTYAGFIFRLLPSIDKNKIVYTPHGFAFLRDDHPVLRKAYWFIEKVLTRRCKVIAGCGVDETNIAASLNNKLITHSLVNVCEALVRKTPYRANKPIKIGMVGRITAQKGVSFFANVANQFSGDVEFIWIGGGESDGVEVLKAAGVKVTGWLKRPEVLSQLEQLDLYFHTAAWDGFPVSVLEAVEMSLPILLREIGPFTAENLYCLKNEELAVSEINKIIEGKDEALKRALKNNKDIAFSHTCENLEKALTISYDYVVCANR